MAQLDTTIDWRLFGNLDLQKSLTNTNDGLFIQGVILTDDQDTAGETPVLKSMDWSYFDKNGFIKYEHDADGKPHPATVIGIPHMRKSLPHGEFLKGRLIPRNPADLESAQDKKDYALETAALIKAIQRHNQQFPTKKRTIGFSIEGKYLSKSADGGYWGKVINVVVTPNPVGTSTFVEMSDYTRMAKAHNIELIKSLLTGASANPAEMTGGAALRRESLNNSPKNITSRGSKMKFKNRDEAKDYYMGEEGLDEDEAMKKALEAFPDNDNDDNDDAEKSLVKETGLLRKSIEQLTGLFKKSQEIEPEPKIEPEPDGDDPIDITPYFESLQKSVGATQSVNGGLVEAMTQLAKVHEANTEMMKSMNTQIGDLKGIIEKQEKMLKAIGMQNGDVSFLNLDAEKIADEQSKKKLEKSFVLGKLGDLAQAGKIPGTEITKFELSGQLPPHIAAFPEFSN